MGPKKCCVKDCPSVSSSSQVSFHRLPKDEKRHQVWLNFLTSANGSENLPKETFICSLHFKSSSFSKTGIERTYLIPGNSPCLNPAIENETCEIEVDISTDEMVVESCEANLLKKQLDEANATIAKLQKELETLREEARVLRQYKKRHEGIKRKITESSEDIVPVKRSKIWWNSDEAVSVRGIFEELMTSNNTTGNRFSDQTKEFAYQLHYLSPRAYTFLREAFGNTLPCPRNFSKWTQHILTGPGFIDLSLGYIKSRNLNSTYLLSYSVTFDEISIRKQILFDGQKFKGFINYGGIICQIPSDIEAKSALFILASEINGHSAVPIGYILTNGLDSRLMSTVVSKSLEKMHDSWAKVMNVTFDGLKSNFTSMEVLGAHFDIGSGNIKPFLAHPSTGSKVFVFPDPVHMIKLLRNTLKSYKVLYDSDGQAIEWKYLDQLLKLQNESGLRAANKLTNRHVNFEQQKMKVKLCTQTFSNSVAVSLQVCQKLKIPEFNGSSATSKFIRLVDRLFDALNSRSNCKGFKAPLSQSNRRFWQPLFNEASAYLKGLTCVNKKGERIPLYRSQRGTCVKGFLVAIESLRMIMDEIVGRDGSDLQYLPVYKLSQDVIELFFGILRSRFGYNNNPNVVQLEHGLKAVLCSNLRPGLNGNAIPLVEYNTRISALGSIAALRNPHLVPQEDLDSITEPPDFQSLSLFVNNIVVYIAGYVGKSIAPKIRCGSCFLALISDSKALTSERSDAVLLTEKDNGGLFIPSSDLIQVCKIAEIEVRRAIPIGLSSLCKKNVVHNVIRHSNVPTIFTNLRTEVNEDHPRFSDHTFVLVKSISEEYLKIRLHYLSKDRTYKLSPETNRSSCTKSVHFKGN